MKEKKEKPKVSSVKLTPATHEKLKAYCNMTRQNMTGLVDQLINDFLEDKFLNNNGIELERPFYSYIPKSFIERETEATTEEPYYNFSMWQEIKKIPNNLDSWNKKYKTFCYKDKYTQHRGIKQLLTIGVDREGKEFKIIPRVIYLLFVYDYKAFDLEKMEKMEYKLRIGKLNDNDLRKILNKNVEEENKLLCVFEENKNKWNDLVNNANFENIEGLKDIRADVSIINMQINKLKREFKPVSNNTIILKYPKNIDMYALYLI